LSNNYPLKPAPINNPKTKPVPTAPVVPAEFVLPSDGGPMKSAVALLSDFCGVQPGLIGAVKARAKVLGISLSTLKRAQKFLGLRHIEKDGKSFWGMPLGVDPCEYPCE
jgi:hypothetical protein